MNSTDRPATTQPDWDCIVIGAGPAGLSAALVLGRARRRVLVLDSQTPRNYATRAMHGVLGHDGLDPAELRARGRAELARYEVQVLAVEVDRVERVTDAVRVVHSGGTELARTVLLATGLLDEVPAVPGFADVWGTSAHTCPYCDGYEHRDERLAVLASGDRAEHLGILLRQWSDDVVVLTDGPAGLHPDQIARMQAVGVVIDQAPIAGLDSDGGQLRQIRLQDGRALQRDALFFYRAWQLRNELAVNLGCDTNADGSLRVDSDQATSVDRIYAAGNCTEPRALVPVAAGAGVTAAVAINTRLSFDAADCAVPRTHVPPSEREGPVIKGAGRGND